MKGELGMTKSYKSLFPELDLTAAFIVAALPIFAAILFHFVIDPLTGADGDEVFIRLLVILSYGEGMICYFMFDGYSQSEQSGISYLCSLPNRRRTVVSAFAGAVVYDLVTMAAAVMASAYLPKLFGENKDVGIKQAVFMFACISAFFGVYIMFCALTRSLAVLITVGICLDAVIETVYLLKSGNDEAFVPICAVSAAIYIIGVIFALCSILKRMDMEGIK